MMNLTTDPDQISFLTDGRSVRYLSPFLAAESSVPQAAQLLSVTQQRASYWVEKMLKLKLIEFVRFEKKGKRDVSIYRSVQDEFHVTMTPSRFDQAMHQLQTVQGLRFTQLQSTIARNFSSRAKHAVIRLWRSPHHGCMSKLSNTQNPDDFFGLTSEFFFLWLDDDELLELHQQTRAFVQHWLARSDATKKKNPALLYCAVADDPIPLADL